MKRYGLIGRSLKHSFSQKYFSEKFEQETIEAAFELYELEQIEDLPDLIDREKDLHGLSVTIPYKEQVIKYLDAITEEANAVGAVNAIAIREGGLIGHNTDIYGFKKSLLKLLPEDFSSSALILGTGGAAKAVAYVLNNLKQIKNVTSVSRNAGKDAISYGALNEETINGSMLIVNATPVGTYPDASAFPDIPFQFLGTGHVLFDLVYNPSETSFMKKGREAGARTKNGLEMLELQAEEAWAFWGDH